VPTLLIRFPGGRYHATPWGYHVNEGLIEWPPSPWRLLRAFLATGYTKLGWTADGPPEPARSLIDKLASVLPLYRLPAAAGAHTRHYMPLGLLEKGREKTTLIFDTWAQVDDGILAIRWDLALEKEELQILQSIVDHLGYLGRSESWVIASLASDDESLPRGTDAFPCDDGARIGLDWEQIAMLAPVSTSDYAEWRRGALENQLVTLLGANASKKKLTKGESKKVRAIEESYPPDLIACLQVQTKWLRKLGWSQPPGSRRVFYARRADCLEAGAPRSKRTSIEPRPVQAMLLSMVSSTSNNHALPRITRTLPQAELLHREFDRLSKISSMRSEALLGRDENGGPLRLGHRHAHLIPLDLDGDGHLEHILIWSPMLLDGKAQKAIRAVRRTFTKGGTGPLRLALAGSGSLSDLMRLTEPYGARLRSLLGPSSTWRSLTPLVPVRYLKQRGHNTLEGQVRSEIAARGLPRPLRISVLDQRDEGLLTHRHFARNKRLGPRPPVDCGFAIEIQFNEQVSGPIALGYACHFGLGVFTSEPIWV
jgi:CRISPR-associated protein Csb2